MYKNITVQIPEVQGKIIRKKKGDSTYILFQYGQVYNKEKQYSIPQRSIIGKVSPADEDRMFPNENFEEYFPDADIPEELPEGYRSCSLRIGTYAVIRSFRKPNRSMK